MSSFFSFGEKIPEYDMKVLNEREVRASAGILFLFAMISFLNSWLIGDFTITKIFVVVFLVDFTIRVLINPKYSPTLILGRFFVRNQEVEYVGAPQKRFAWMIGLALAILMFFLIVLNNLIGPFNLLVCLICLTLLFFEAAFGICLGCKIYNLFHKQKAELCPGNACAIKDRVEIQKINPIQYLLVPAFLALIYVVANSSLINTKKVQQQRASLTSSEDCVAPDWAVQMGHEEKWKLHNGCGNTMDKADKKPDSIKEAVTTAPATTKTDITPKAPPVAKSAKGEKDCTVPDWAIKMGHKDKWKLHNGCSDAPESNAELSKEVVAPIPVPEKTVVEPTPPINNHTGSADKDCTVPEWAIKMGHKDKWKLHNGCQ